MNAQGHVTGGSNPTTLAGYGITDAEPKGAADSALASAKTYADNAANAVKNDLLNNAGAAYDTLKELGDLIDDNKDAIDALEDIAAGKANATHTHAIADVTGLQSALDGKAASSHGTHVTYSTTAPVMDGTAAVGTASTVARSDHKHPTDTSRAAQTSLDSHTANTTAHITATERTNWNAAKTHADSAHAPSNAEKNQNAFSNIKVGTTTIAADATTDTLELVGSNVTITPDATNDKVTIAVASGSTSTAGILKLTNSTSSTSTTTAATPSSVKSAYDLANTAKTNAATAQTRADNAYTLAEGKVDSLSDLGITATADELNYVDGVTSNIQTQLDGKAASSHTHSYAGSSSAGGAATSANKVNSSLTVKLNGGTTEGTNLFTFNGSAAKSVNITPSAIGAATSSHTHDDRYYTESEIDSKLSGKANTSHGNHVPATQTASNKVFLRNDNTWATVTPANIGAAASSHTHTVANITDLTATAAELNYMDGVTSNVQAQLDSKLSTSGGTISGIITTTDGDVVNRNITTGGTYYYGGTGFDDGAFLGLYGKDQSNYAGQFRLKADNGESFAYLEGMPSGQLRWNNKTVATLNSSGAIPIADGGTGARSSSGALANLGGVPLAGGEMTGALKLPRLSATNTSAYIGSMTVPFQQVYTKNVYIQDGTNDTVSYGDFRAQTTGTASVVGKAQLDVGNSTKTGTAGNARGVVRVYGTGAYYHQIQGDATANRTLTLPNKNGTLATTDDVSTTKALTTAEYAELEQAGEINANTLYMLTDAEEEEEVLITTDDIDTICGVTI